MREKLPELVPKLRFGNATARMSFRLCVCGAKNFIYEKSVCFVFFGYAKPELCAQLRSQAGAWEREFSIY
jgi:hypothetical protein